MLGDKHSLRIVSWNVRGFVTHIKKRKILSALAKLNCAKALIQESHLDENEANKLKRSWVGQVFTSSYTSKARGVLMLVHKKVNFQLIDTLQDSEGRIIGIRVKVGDMELGIINIYAPNSNQATFFNSLLANITSWSSIPLIIAGDFNSVIDEDIDSSNNSTRYIQSSSRQLTCLLNELGLVDKWRLLNPTERDYIYSLPTPTYIFF